MLFTVPGAVAQYYPQPYAPSYPAPGYYPPAPQYYPPPPGYYPAPVEFGGRCFTQVPTVYGLLQSVCALAGPHPLGQPCFCPPPPSPGYAPGPFSTGRVVP